MQARDRVAEVGAPGELDVEGKLVTCHQPVDRRAAFARDGAGELLVGFAARLLHDVGEHRTRSVFDALVALRLGGGRADEALCHAGRSARRCVALQHHDVGAGVRGCQGRRHSGPATADHQHRDAGVERHRVGADHRHRLTLLRDVEAERCSPGHELYAPATKIVNAASHANSDRAQSGFPPRQSRFPILPNFCADFWHSCRANAAIRRGPRQVGPAG